MNNKNLNLLKLKNMANAIRCLSIDSIEKANSGHPGMPLGFADVATVLFNYFLKFDPLSPKWINRDRFILSAGHGSMLLYSLSYLLGYRDTPLNQLKKFRMLGSKTAGHPEYGLLDIIETTTGPLGQGLANSVGMALAEQFLNKKFGSKIIDHKTFVVVGDGCLMEGISQEAISLAGHKKLNKLIVLFDNNGISIDGPTSLATSENHIMRFKACGWNADEIDGHNYLQIYNTIKKSLKSQKPSFISCKTKIGFGSPNKEGTEKSHGSPLGAEEAIITKRNLNCNWPKFEVPTEIKKNWRNISIKNKKLRIRWEEKLLDDKNTKHFFNQFKKQNYNRNKKIKNFLGSIVSKKISEASRKSSQNSLNILSSNYKNLLGGSADLTGSNLTNLSNKILNGKNVNYIHYGVREHLMAAAMNGIALHGGFIPYGGTFLIFSDYCKNAIRLSAMMKLHLVYVFTHDSIGLGEDGPTHQPIEQLSNLRSIPNLKVFRPCDAIETFECWEIALAKKITSAIVLSRQNIPLVRQKFENNLVAKGAYFIKKYKDSHLTILATGSEVCLANKIHNILYKKKIKCNIVSIPCFEIFDEQSADYKRKILGDKPRVSIEAGSTQSWYKYLDHSDLIIGVDSFGESGKGEQLFDYFGLDEIKISERIISRFF